MVFSLSATLKGTITCNVAQRVKLWPGVFLVTLFAAEFRLILFTVGCGTRVSVLGAIGIYHRPKTPLACTSPKNFTLATPAARLLAFAPSF
jgi:hypothetical protein